MEDTEAQVVEVSSAYRMKQALAAVEKVQETAKVWLAHKDSRPASPAIPAEDGPVNLSVSSSLSLSDPLCSLQLSRGTKDWALHVVFAYFCSTFFVS